MLQKRQLDTHTNGQRQIDTQADRQPVTKEVTLKIVVIAKPPRDKKFRSLCVLVSFGYAMFLSKKIISVALLFELNLRWQQWQSRHFNAT